MEAYRDQYATLFHNGRNVVVIGISVDPDTTLINWFRELETPIVVMSDADARVSRIYQSYNETGKTDARHLYLLDHEGRVTYKQLPFRVMAGDAYTELAAEIDKLEPPKKEGPH